MPYLPSAAAQMMTTAAVSRFELICLILCHFCPIGLKVLYPSTAAWFGGLVFRALDSKSNLKGHKLNPGQFAMKYQPWASCSHIDVSLFTKQYNLVLAKCGDASWLGR